MRLYTNKFPALGQICIGQDNLVIDEDIKVIIPEGKIFKVVGFDNQGIVLSCEGKSIVVSGSVFAVSFVETEV